MSMEMNRGNNDAAMQTKLRLFKTALYGFIISLIVTVFSLFTMGAVSLLGVLWTNGRVIQTAGDMIGGAVPYFFAAPFLFFALLMTSLLMKPREADLASRMKPSLVGIVIILAGGIMLCAFTILTAFIIFMAVLYFRGNGIIFLAIAYFGAAGILFFMTVGYALIREAAANRALQTDTAWVRRAFRVLRVGGTGGGPEIDEKSHNALTRIEQIAGSLLGTAMFLLFKAQDLYESSQKGWGSGTSWFDAFATMDAVLGAMALSIFMFSTVLIIKAVKTFFTVRKTGTPGSAAPAA